MGRPGLLGTMARTAVIAGTATATAGAVSGHAQKKQAQQQAAAQQQQEQQAQQAQQQAAAQPASAPAGDDVVAQLTKLSDMKAQGLLSESEFDAAKVKLLGS
jgi:hemolysin activation/secretion protein